jgi:hypothetical protein
LKALEASGDAAPEESTSPAEPTTTVATTTDATTTDATAADAKAADGKAGDTKASGSSGSDLAQPVEPASAREKSALDLEGESSTTAAERQAMLDQAMLDQANQVTRDERQR